MYKIKTYEELDFTDDFLFCKILEKYPELAKELLEMILQIRIREVKVNRQVPIDQIREGRGIRLDVYTFKNLCMENPKLELGDDTTKVFLNASGTVGEISEELRDFFNLLNKRKTKSDLSRKIEAAVKSARAHNEWRAEYMTLEMHYQEKYEEGLEEGREEGRVRTLIKLVQKGKLSISEAAEEAEMTEKEFEELLKTTED